MLEHESAHYRLLLVRLDHLAEELATSLKLLDGFVLRHLPCFTILLTRPWSLSKLMKRIMLPRFTVRVGHAATLVSSAKRAGPQQVSVVALNKNQLISSTSMRHAYFITATHMGHETVRSLGINR